MIRDPSGTGGVAGPARRPRELGDRRARHRLQPDALPDAGRARVPDVVRLGLPVLLAARLTGVQWPVLGPHDEKGVLAVARQRPRDIEREGDVPALVLPHEPAVDPHARPVVDRAEVQQDPLSLGRSTSAGQVVGGDRARVPHDRVVAGLPDAGETALGREGNGDGALADAAGGPVPIQSRLGVVVGEVPGPVQTAPVGAAQLGEGVAPGRVRVRPVPRRGAPGGPGGLTGRLRSLGCLSGFSRFGDVGTHPCPLSRPARVECATTPGSVDGPFRGGMMGRAR